MKKYLLSVLTACTMGAFGQSIPNGGFENWNVTSYENLMYYFTSNNENNNGIFNVTKVNDPYHGSHAVKLATVPSGTNVQMAFIANGDPMMPAGQGIPYNQQATGISFRYKLSTMPNDSALIWVIFKKAGLVIGNYLKKFAGTQTTYALKTYSFSLAQAPDSVIFAAASSDPFTYSGPSGSTFQLDSVNFTGVTSQPANFNGSFELWQMVNDKTPMGWSINGSGFGTTQSTDFYSGNYALELQTYSSGTVAYANGATNGTPSPSTTLGGSPYSNTNDTLVFYYKYFPSNSNDSAYVHLDFKKLFVFYSGVTKKLPASNVYKQEKIVINLGSAPDTMLIFLNSSKNYSVPVSYSGAIFKIDNMYLTSQMVPVTNFTVNPNACANSSITLNDNSYNLPTAYTWTMSGATPSVSTAQNPVVTYTTAGTYTISHNTSNSYGSGTVVTQTITINPLPVLTVNSATICSGQSVNLFANGAPSYVWSNGATTTTIAVSPTITTNYTVVGTATTGCSTSAVANVMVNAIPSLSITNSSPICAGTSTNFFVSGASTYSWNTGATTNSITVNPGVTTQYGVVGTATNGCQSTATVMLTVNPSPTLSVTGFNTVCIGNSVVLNVTGASTYTWAVGPTTPTIAVSPTVNTSYSVTGTGTNGCMGMAYMSLTVNPLPSITASTNISIICGPPFQGTATLTANGGVNYTWTPGGPGTSIAVSPSVTSTYTLIGTDANGCSNSTAITQSVSTCTGMNELGSNTYALIAFPNPNNGSFKIHSSSEDLILVLNDLGQLVKTIELNSNNNYTETLTDLSAGVYFGSGRSGKFKVVVIR